MAEYRTITIAATISPDISVAASVRVDHPGATAVGTVTDKIVTAEATVSPSTVDATASIVDMTVEAEADVVTKIQAGDYPTYGGPYEVTPKAAEEQVLKTERKVVLHDITVHEVPYWETSNHSGMTAFIASEV